MNSENENKDNIKSEMQRWLDVYSKNENVKAQKYLKEIYQFCDEASMRIRLNAIEMGISDYKYDKTLKYDNDVFECIKNGICVPFFHPPVRLGVLIAIVVFVNQLGEKENKSTELRYLQKLLYSFFTEIKLAAGGKTKGFKKNAP